MTKIKTKLFKSIFTPSYRVVLFSLYLFCREISAFNPQTIFDAVSESVVVIHTFDQEKEPTKQGSGVVIRPHSVLTNCHVITGGPEHHVCRGSDCEPAEIKMVDMPRDLCELQVQTALKPVSKILPISELRPGLRVVTLGAPKGLELTLADGIISAIRERNGEMVIQTTAAISGGSSGGGLFDENGYLIGITTLMIEDGQNLNFAFPAIWSEELPERNVIKSPEEGALMMQSKHLLDNVKNNPAALETAKEILEKNPDNWYVQLLAGDALSRENRLSEALYHYEKGLEGQPDNEQLQGIIFSAANEAGNFAVAEKYISQLYQNNPEEDEYLTLRFTTLLKLEKDREAIEFLNSHIRKHGDESGLCHGLLGDWHLKNSNFTESIKNFSQALKKNDADPELRLGLAKSFYQQNNFASIQELVNDSVLTNESTGPEAYAILAETKFALNDREKGISLFVRGVRLFPNDMELAEKFALSLYKEKQWSAIISHFELEATLGMRPLPTAIFRFLGEAHAHNQNYVKAIATLRKAIEKEPESVRNHILLGSCEGRLNRWDKALEAFKNAQRLEPDNRTVLKRLALALKNTGNEDEARRIMMNLRTSPNREEDDL
jgi:tetratricopeptide (TPR) repeat protein